VAISIHLVARGTKTLLERDTAKLPTGSTALLCGERSRRRSR
jgi:hypothetical protein